MAFKSIKILGATLLIGLFAQSTWANLLIHPTRIQFNPSDRTVDVTLTNTSNSTKTYRLEWSEKRALEKGGYAPLSTQAAANFPTASGMIRFSPRQVTLKPGERQTIKMAIRRPQNLAAGEYRSHLVFKALSSGKPDPENAISAPGMLIGVNLSFGVPVVISQGTPQYSVSLANADLHYNPATNTGKVNITINRSGSHSVIGDLKAYWTPNGGKEQLIAKTADFNLWPEVNTISPPLTWVGTSFAKTDGKLRIVYEGVKEFRGKVFFDQTINVSGGAIRM